MDPGLLAMLIAKARAAQANAYAPASRFAVGAALLGVDGRVFAGCNVENASFGLTLCAERNALGTAVAEGVRAFHALVVVTPVVEPAYPCGACRQVLAEFAPKLPLFLVGRDDRIVRSTVEQLLPHALQRRYLG